MEKSVLLAENLSPKVMKKIALIVSFLTICIAFELNAQDSLAVAQQEQHSPKLRMGLSVSPLVSWFSTDGDGGQVATDGSRFNIKYGLHIDTRLGGNQNYYFSTGIFVMNTGGKLTHQYFNNAPGSDTLQSTVRASTYRFNYVNIPITMMLRTNEIGYLTYFARVGFDAGFNIKATADYEDRFADGQVVSAEDEDASDFVGLFRAGLHIEGGIEYNFSGTSRFLVSLEWNNGLNNIFNSDYKLPVVDDQGGLDYDDGGNVITDRKVKGSSSLIMLNLGVYF